MDFSAIKDLYIGSTPVQSAWLNGSKVWGRKPVVDEQAIRDAMVLWYDLKRQGATNESMAADPTLRDLSGNGHDATCYNFAWSGMSGIGGYLPIGNAFSNPNNTTGIATIEGNKVHITNTPDIVCAAYNNGLCAPGETRPETSFKVTGLTGTGLVLKASAIYGLPNEITQDGIYTYPEYTNTNQSETYNDLYFDENSYDVACNITIEQLPQYPHALVFDGVDDYILYENKIADKIEDFTIIEKYCNRKQLGADNYSIVFCQTGYYDQNYEQGRKMIALGELDGTNQNTYLYSMGSPNIFPKIDYIYDNPVTVYMTNTSFDGKYQLKTSYDIIYLKDNKLEIGSPVSSVGKNNTYHGEFYSLLFFNRTLSIDEIAWVKTNLIEGNDDDAEWYGVEFYTTSPNPDCIRIGNMDLHRSLPVQSQMRGCLLNDDGEVTKYLNATDWTSETRDGSQGQVMVEMPKNSYWKFETDGNIRRVKFSTKPLPGFKPTPQGYVSAYEASLQRSTIRLSSVVNTDSDYRGGNNNANWDGTYRSLLGMPTTHINRTNLRIYARKRKADSTEWNMMTYDMQKLLYWLFVVEYATLNTQKAFNPDKDANGYAQGGLGNGVTSLDGTKWNTFNRYYPVIPCGHTDSLGNGTGEVDYQMPEEYDTNVLTVKVPRYRGIENPFGHLLQWTDGINVRISPNEPYGDGLSKVYVCSDPSKFNDTNYDGYTYVGDGVRTPAYVKEVIFGEGGEIIPSVVGGSTTTYFCDYHYTNIPAAETLRGVLFGGHANYGALAGFVFAYSGSTPSAASAYFGSRLCFIPNN